MSDLKIEIKNLKTFLASDGYAMSATVYVNGKRAFVATNSGEGGPNNYQVIDQAAYDAAEAYAKEIAQYDFEQLDELVGELIERHEVDKKLKALCKKNTLYRLPGDDYTEYYIVKHPLTDEVKRYITRKYPDAVIINEQFA